MPVRLKEDAAAVREATYVAVSEAAMRGLDTVRDGTSVR